MTESGKVSAVVAQSAVNGGAEKYLRMLYATNPNVTLYGNIPEWSHDSVDLSLGPKWGRQTLAAGLLRLPSERRRTLRALRNSTLDNIHMQFKREQVGFTEALADEAPVFWTEHGVMTRGMRFALTAGYRRASSRASGIVCVSDEVACQVRTLVGRSIPLTVIENPVDVVALEPPTADERSSAKISLGIDPDTPVAVWVGRVDVGKRPEIAARVAEEWNGVVLLAGDGPLLPTLRGRRVRTFGYTDPGPLYRAADALLMTSNGAGEGLPNNALLEAAAHGVPAVVDGTIPAFRRVAHQSGGVAVSESRWIDGLRSILHEPERRAKARAWAMAHSIDEWRSQHEEFFTSA